MEDPDSDLGQMRDSRKKTGVSPLDTQLQKSKGLVLRSNCLCHFASAKLQVWHIVMALQSLYY